MERKQSRVSQFARQTKHEIRIEMEDDVAKRAQHRTGNNYKFFCAQLLERISNANICMHICTSQKKILNLDSLNERRNFFFVASSQTK